MGPQEVPAEQHLRSREAHIPGEEGGHRMRLAEVVDHMVREEEDGHSLVAVEDTRSPVVGSLEEGLAEGRRTRLAEDHQEDHGAGIRLVEEDSILLVVEEGHLEEARTAGVEDKASALVEGVLAEDILQAGLLFVGVLVHSRDTSQSVERTHGAVYCMTCRLLEMRGSNGRDRRVFEVEWGEMEQTRDVGV